ncbi:hypothetical protein C2G38_2151202 [Gigaspora rosea]|uniref:CBM20 domain-containing protein n=1 Tax=Gigaspora rosea TaxID=44941 RepID=A0A397W8K7_9GLOM|nr:hypothetical protein C2G38_2151202 [Gigaspora rosea]
MNRNENKKNDAYENSYFRKQENDSFPNTLQNDNDLSNNSVNDSQKNLSFLAANTDKKLSQSNPYSQNAVTDEQGLQHYKQSNKNENYRSNGGYDQNENYQSNSGHQQNKNYQSNSGHYRNENYQSNSGNYQYENYQSNGGKYQYENYRDQFNDENSNNASNINIDPSLCITSVFHVYLPATIDTLQPAVVGNCPTLENWKEPKVLLKNIQNSTLWVSDPVPIPTNFEIEYKYCLFRT